MPHGMNLLWDVLSLALISFMVWWPWHCIKEDERRREPQPDECPRCGRMVEYIEMHIKRCNGQLVRRNPLSGSLSTMFRSFQKSENVDVLKETKPPKKDDELEDLY
jgi:hypothetical protein